MEGGEGEGECGYGCVCGCDCVEVCRCDCMGEEECVGRAALIAAAKYDIVCVWWGTRGGGGSVCMDVCVIVCVGGV